MRVLAQYIGFLRQLRIYSHESEDEWFRFITHKKKLFMSAQAEGELFSIDKNPERPGVDFVTQGKADPV